MSNIKKTLQMTSLLFGMATLFCYIAWCLGYEGFIIIGDVYIPQIIADLICAILFAIHMSLQTGFVMDWYNWKVLWFAIPLTFCNAIGCLYLPPIIFTGILPSIVFIFAAIKKHGWKKRSLRPLIVIAVTVAHQGFVSIFSNLNLAVDISMYQVLRLSISEILLTLLLYAIGGVLYHGHRRSNRLELLVFPGRVRDDKNRNESRQPDQKSTEDVPVGTFEVWVMRAAIAVVQVLQWMFILWVCNLDNLFLDALVMTASFICYGMIISKRQHFKPVILCTLAATAMFYFAARFTISFQYSHFFPIFIGLLLAYTVYRISYEIEKANKQKLTKELERIYELETKIDQVWEQLEKLDN